MMRCIDCKSDSLVVSYFHLANDLTTQQSDYRTRRLKVIEPLLEFWVFSSHDFEEGCLELLGDRTRFSLPYRSIVDLPDRGDLSRCTREEGFMSRIDLIPGESILHQRNFLPLCNLNH